MTHMKCNDDSTVSHLPDKLATVHSLLIIFTASDCQQHKKASLLSQVLCSTQHKIAHFGDVLSSQLSTSQEIS